MHLLLFGNDVVCSIGSTVSDSIKKGLALVLLVLVLLALVLLVSVFRTKATKAYATEQLQSPEVRKHIAP